MTRFRRMHTLQKFAAVHATFRAPSTRDKEGVRAYQQDDLHLMQDLADGTAALNVDLLAACATAPTPVEQPTAGTTLESWPPAEI